MRGFKLESLELVCAVIVTAGLVAGNLLLFFPFQHDNRSSPPPGHLFRPLDRCNVECCESRLKLVCDPFHEFA